MSGLCVYCAHQKVKLIVCKCVALRACLTLQECGAKKKTGHFLEI